MCLVANLAVPGTRSGGQRHEAQVLRQGAGAGRRQVYDGHRLAVGLVVVRQHVDNELPSRHEPHVVASDFGRGVTGLGHRGHGAHEPDGEKSEERLWDLGVEPDECAELRRQVAERVKALRAVLG